MSSLQLSACPAAVPPPSPTASALVAACSSLFSVDSPPLISLHYFLLFLLLFPPSLISHSPPPSISIPPFPLTPACIQCTVSPPPPRMSVTELPLPPLQATRVWLWGIWASPTELRADPGGPGPGLLTSGLPTTALPCRGASSCRAPGRAAAWPRPGGSPPPACFSTRRSGAAAPRRAPPDPPASASRLRTWPTATMVRPLGGSCLLRSPPTCFFFFLTLHQVLPEVPKYSPA